MNISKSKKAESTSAPFSPIPCPKCKSTAMEYGPIVSLVSSEKKSDESGWVATGNVRLIRCFHGRCCNCGFETEAIRQEIPFRYKQENCPNCGQSNQFHCEVEKIKLEGESYSFSAVIQCLNCEKKGRFTKSLRKLWSISSIKFSGFGVEVEVGKK